MTTPPQKPKIYHITHVANLPSIIEAGGLWSDAEMARRQLADEKIGMNRIKQRRLQECLVEAHGRYVGEYVPFYFCPRSVMLFVIHCRNHPDLDYKGGQSLILHLQADLHATVAWADANNRPWAFSTRNAATAYTDFHYTLDSLDRVNWKAVYSHDFRNQQVKDEKQAEFLVLDWFPWSLVEKIGVLSDALKAEVGKIVKRAEHQPTVKVQRDWYYPE